MRSELKISGLSVVVYTLILPPPPKKKPIMVVHTYNPSICKAEAGGLFGVSLRPTWTTQNETVSKNRGGEMPEKKF